MTDKKVIRQRLRMMRTAMRESGLDYYLVPTADFHNSEYVSDYFKAREYLSGFTEIGRASCRERV